MNQLATWNPFKEMDELQRRFDNLLGRTSAYRNGTKEDEGITIPEWSPVVDIVEDEKSFTITAELPGVKKEDVKVMVENGVLQVSGQRAFEKKDENKRYHRIERFYGNFVRSFSLPDSADGSKVDARFKDGVLTLTLAKREESKPKAIEIKVS